MSASARRHHAPNLTCMARKSRSAAAATPARRPMQARYASTDQRFTTATVPAHGRACLRPAVVVAVSQERERATTSRGGRRQPQLEQAHSTTTARRSESAQRRSERTSRSTARRPINSRLTIRRRVRRTTSRSAPRALRSVTPVSALRPSTAFQAA